jgi:hypothetical protein
MSINTNLVGSPLDKGVIDQISARADLHTKNGYLDDNSAIFRSKKNAWLKLTSFVEVTDSVLATTLGGTGTDVAKKWCLFNGLHGTNGVDRKPLGMEGYGVGGIMELGFRPMPGLTSATIEAAGTGGSIQIATVKAKAWTLEQLNYIDVLYMRLGFSLLLEWGHGIYSDNNGNIKISESPMDIFSKNLTKEQVLKELAKKRKSSLGNYDGMLGLVTNFSWEQTSDGGYDITLSLTGIGSIVESLKINGTETIPTIIPKAAPGNTVPTVSQTATKKVSSSLETFLSFSKNIALQNKSQAEFYQYMGYVFKFGLNLLKQVQPGVVQSEILENFKRGFNSEYMSDSAKVPEVDFTKLATYSKVNFVTGDNTKTDFVYIPLGLILAYINNSCVFYDKQKNNTRPIIYIDFNPETNFCFRMPQQFSIDPRVCIVDLGCTDADFNMLFSSRNINPATITDKFNQTTNDLTNNIYNLQGLSAYQDPKVKSGTRGKLMNILVNIDKVLEICQSLRDPKTSNVYLGKFLDELLSQINRALGGVNNFRVGYNDASNTVRIYDDQLVDSDSGPAASNLPTLPIFGLSSIMRSFSLKTETSTRIGSLLAITAMAGERRPVAGNEDGSAFTALNSRLRDRLMPVRESVVTEAVGSLDSTNSGNIQGLTDSAQLFNNHVRNIYALFKFNASDIETCIQFYPETMNSLKTELKTQNGNNVVEANDVTARGILPLAANFTLDGISGIKLYEAFILPLDRLPAQYKEGNSTRIGFTVAGLSHTIDNQQWVTTVRAMMINIPKQTGRVSGSFRKKGKTPRPAGGGGGAPQPTPAAVSALGFGLPVSKPYLVTSFINRARTKQYNTPVVARSRHEGMDILGPNTGNKNDTLSLQLGGKGTNGDKIFSIGDGTVARAGASSGYGYAIYILHKIGNDEYTSVYGHMPLDSIDVKQNDLVTKGQHIAYIGNEGTSTGFHLHFELWKGNIAFNRSGGIFLDPVDYLPFFSLNGGNVPGNIMNVQQQYS